MRVELTGGAALSAHLARLAAQMPRAVGASLYRFAEGVMAESKPEVPVQTGTLRASGHVEPPVLTSRGAEVELGYGGPAEAYALQVHEDLQAHHAEPTKAKYLEDPLKRRSADLLPTVGADVERALVAGG